MKQILKSHSMAIAAIFGLVIAVAIAGAPRRAMGQNLPPSGAYQPIPDYTGTNAGLLFREAINDRLSGAQPISPSVVSLDFANLPAEQDGTLFYCVDCQKASPCAGGGSGAWAMGQNGAWSCTAGVSNLSMGGDVTGASNASIVNTVLGGKTPVVTSGANVAGGTSVAAALNGFNLGGVADVTNPVYGAVCSATTLSCTSNGTTTITCSGAPADFKVGQNIVAPLMGASNALTTPTISLAEPDSWYYAQPPPVFSGSSSISNTCTVDSSSSAYKNTSCSTTYGYSLQSVAFNGSISAPSAIVYVTGGPAVLSLANAIALEWTTDPNAVGYILKRCTGASCTPTSVIKVYPNLPVGQTSGSTFFAGDVGNAYGHSEYTLTNTAQSGFLNTTITAINGTSVTLATAPSQSGLFTMYHDDEPAFAAAVHAVEQASGSGSGTVKVPACANPYTFGQTLSLVGYLGTRIIGASAPEGTTSNIEWLGPIGGIVINGNWAISIDIENIGVPSGSYNDTPGIVFDPDIYNGPAGIGGGVGPGGNNSGNSLITTTSWNLRNDECGEAGICLEMGNPNSDRNIENMRIDHLECSTPNGYGGYACIDGNSQETYNETLDNVWSSDRDFAINFARVGGFTMRGFGPENNVADLNIGIISDTAAVDGCVSEGAQHFLHFDGIQDSLRIASCRVAPNPGPDGYFATVQGGALHFEDNVIEPSSMGVANMALGAEDGAVLENNRFDQILSGPYPATAGNAPLTDCNSGEVAPGPYIELNDNVFNGSTWTNIPLTLGGVVSPYGGGFAIPGKLTLSNAILQQFADASPSASYQPSVASCGTSAAATGTNLAPVITVGSTNPTTSCVLTFNTHQAFTHAPTCTFEDVTKGIGLIQTSLANTGVTLGAPSGVTDLHGDTINGTCIGN